MGTMEFLFWLGIVYAVITALAFINPGAGSSNGSGGGSRGRW